MGDVLYESVSHLSDQELDKEISFAQRSLDQNDSWLTLGWLIHLNNEKLKRLIRKVINNNECNE